MTTTIPLPDAILGDLGSVYSKLAPACAIVPGTSAPAASSTAATGPSSHVSRASDASPADWDSYIGQRHAKAELRIRIQAALNAGRPLVSTLLVGDGGLGKTTLAQLIAAELGRELCIITKPMRTEQLLDRLWALPRNAVVFFDEVHQWGKHTNTGGQHALMQLLESRTLDTRTGDTVAFPDLSFIAATTDLHRLSEPFISRFGCVPTIVDYTDEDMGLIIAGMAGRILVPFDSPTMQALAPAAAGHPRTARALVEAGNDLHLAGVPYDAQTVLAMTNIAPDGLTVDHIDYLNALSGATYGQAGLGTLSVLTGLPAERLKRIEKLLARRGLVELGPSGRRITTAGRARVRL